MKVQRTFWLALLCCVGSGGVQAQAADWPKSQTNFVSTKRGETQRWRVKMLQYLLRDQGLKVAVDGNFGKQTERALRSFQEANDLEVTGVARDADWKALTPLVKRGDKGHAVRALQVGINRFIHEHTEPRASPIAVDGSFGTVTAKWLHQLQGANEATDSVDDFTWFSLIYDEH